MYKPYKQITAFGDCYGCGVCAAVCPVGIIGLAPDRQGFLRPAVAEDAACRCTGCGLCTESCAALSTEAAPYRNPLAAWAGYSTDPEVRFRSSSGGVGYELARGCVGSGGTFCGVRYDVAERRAEHYIARDEAALAFSRGSKYIQSHSTAGFREALAASRRGEGSGGADGNSGGNMIVGTPCQVASLRRYLRKMRREDDFTLVDFFCHGVPSLLLWQQYVREREATLGTASEAGFRDKRHGWHDSWRIWGRHGDEEIYFSDREDLFYKYYLRGYTTSLPCYACMFRGARSAADLRIGDMWGDKYGADQEGVTAVVAFTERGLAEVEALGRRVIMTAESVDTVMQGQLRADQPVPSMRRQILAALAGGRTERRLSLAEIYRRYRLRLWLWRLGFRIGRRWKEVREQFR